MLSYYILAYMDEGGFFDTQTLLFDKPWLRTGPVKKRVPEDYYTHGWTVLDGVENELQAVKAAQAFINNIDGPLLPLHLQFASRIKLAKADHIPVCDDIVTTSFQVLHFDMGHPFVESPDQMLVSHVGIYLPMGTEHEVTARTRLVELNGLLSHAGLTAEEIEKKVVTYTRKYGDGWKDTNTYRLACFARFLDSLADKPELQDQRDKTVGQWFQNEKKVDEGTALRNEANFYAKHVIYLQDVEHDILLNPGQLLILDNTRVIHGRIGKRKAEELFNFMFGIERATDEDIKQLRQTISSQLV